MASSLAAGEVIGWVQGRAEFGPRALGHRSILADPRPAATKDRINATVKKREGYRPFSPAVLDERCGDYFVLPRQGIKAPFMSYTMQVKPEAREQLGATTHVDGTARVQTVARDVDPLFWALIDAFGQRTGIPVLLNTSFNNHSEPIVDSLDDAVTCFLTTGLQKLAIGSFVVDKLVSVPQAALALAPSLPAYARLMEVVAADASGPRAVTHQIGTSFDRRTRTVSGDGYRVLKTADGLRSTAAIAHELGVNPSSLADELGALWEARLVVLRPPPG
jgi:carbamoyltransferase